MPFPIGKLLASVFVSDSEPEIINVVFYFPASTVVRNQTLVRNTNESARTSSICRSAWTKWNTLRGEIVEKTNEINETAKLGIKTLSKAICMLCRVDLFGCSFSAPSARWTSRLLHKTHSDLERKKNFKCKKRFPTWTSGKWGKSIFQFAGSAVFVVCLQSFLRCICANWNNLHH